MNKSLIHMAVSGLMLLCIAEGAHAQTDNYSQQAVTISKDKVKVNNVSYYSHVVLERQTLFSISRAYGVSVQQIYDANPALRLETEGLKKHQIILIPMADQPQSADDKHGTAAYAEDLAGKQNSAGKTEAAGTTAGQNGYVTHQVKWFEDLRSIARKYNVSAEQIMSFNHLESYELEWKQLLKIPVKTPALNHESSTDIPETSVNIAGTATDNKNQSEAVTEAATDTEEDAGFPGIWRRSQKKVSASLILPFESASATPNENNFDFYSGVLIALRDLQKEGISTELNVYDSSRKLNIIAADIKGSDLVIGPISSEELNTVLNIFPGGTGIVSPIEPRAEALASAHENLIQTPASSRSQCEELIRWLKEEKRWDDRVILFTEKAVAASGNAELIIRRMQAEGLSYETVSHDVKEGLAVSDKLERLLTGTGTNRIVIASENKAFLNDVIRAVNSMKNKKYDVAIYCPSRVRSYEDIDVESLHNTKLHTTLSYYVDYSDDRVAAFLRVYRGLYGKEPSVVAFKGYDAAYHIIKMRSVYGSSWMRHLSEKTSSGLQTDFRFEKVGEEGGYINKAVRRILYEPSFDIKLAR